MSRAVLQTRYVGQAPDLRHPLAPPEHVFEVEEPPRAPGIFSFYTLGTVLQAGGAGVIAVLPLIYLLVTFGKL